LLSCKTSSLASKFLASVLIYLSTEKSKIFCSTFCFSLLLSPSTEQKPDADLTKILTLEALSPLFADVEVQQRLFPFLPGKSEHTKEELEDIIRSPQFVQSLAGLNAGLQSGQLGPLIAELGLDPSVGGPLGGEQDFFLFSFSFFSHIESFC